MTYSFFLYSSFTVPYSHTWGFHWSCKQSCKSHSTRVRAFMNELKDTHALCYHHTHRHEHAEARQQPAANYFVFNYFLHCLLWWLLWPFPPEPFLYSASASPTILEAFSLNHVSAMLPGSCPIPHDRPGKKGRGQLKVFYPALKADRTCCTRLSKCHFNSKFMNV